MITETIPGLEKLSREEKLLLSAELWNDAWDDPKDPDRDESMQKVLEKRLEEYKANPERVISYDDLKKKHGLDG